MGAAEKVVSAFTEDEVTQLTQLTLRQLRHWDRTGFFRPALAADDRRAPHSRLYSFRDILSLRVLGILRCQFQVSLQHLRQVSAKLAHLDDERWTKTTLYVLNRKVIFADPENGAPREVVSGQFVVPIPLAVVTKDTHDAIARLRARDESRIGHVERRRNVNRNVSVIAGTRVPVAAVKRLHEDGYSPDEIVNEYPDLTLDDVGAALAFDDSGAEAA